MQIIQKKIITTDALNENLGEITRLQPDILLVFASTDFFIVPNFSGYLQAALPRAVIIGCSTAGEITSDGVHENTCTLTGIRFEYTQVVQASVRLADMTDSLAAGEQLGHQLVYPDLRAILVYSPGVYINGSALIDGLSRTVGRDVVITGGLAGDNGAFKRTFTLGSEGVRDDTVVAVGLTGHALLISYGSCGGWIPFGPPRKVTRCQNNVLFELDNEPALDMYRRYLGAHADKLPASGLLFPLAMYGADQSESGLTRTILGVDKIAGSLILAGNIDPDGYLRLMHANTNRLVRCAETAAESTVDMLHHSNKNTLAILVSCVGRKLIMGDRINEEIEAVAHVFGQQTTLTGFYSYGEISPTGPGAICQLHNQTMTITYLAEDGGNLRDGPV